MLPTQTPATYMEVGTHSHPASNHDQVTKSTQGINANSSNHHAQSSQDEPPSKRTRSHTSLIPSSQFQPSNQEIIRKTNTTQDTGSQNPTQPILDHNQAPTQTSPLPQTLPLSLNILDTQTEPITNGNWTSPQTSQSPLPLPPKTP